MCLAHLAGYPAEASYQCGVRQVQSGHATEEGYWPWHTAVFHRNELDDGFTYAGGATLIHERYALTAAHLVIKRPARNSQPVIMYEIQLHFGRHNLSEMTANVVIRDVGKAHVHPEYRNHKHDIAVLVMRLPVEYSDYVIPACLAQTMNQEALQDQRELEGQRGWVTGWGRTENGTMSEVLRTMSLPVVSYIQCIKADRHLFGILVDENTFCAGDRNGTSPALGSSGGGMYFSDGDRWVIKGILSFGKLDESRQGIDPLSYIVFVNVQRYLTWINEIFAENDS